ncbi:MAG: aspartate/glutamate racemase family protein [Gammaproteobacteria bacterium]|nr:aspartate/glutamate racemase family protein [Gammaproteobacteria bacterium]
MKTIGMLGGMSWESTVSYYQALNEGVKQALGGLHSAKIVMHSVDFDEIEKLQHADNWDATAEILKQSALSVEAGGADFLIICTNTMHLVAAQIEAAINIPVLHIADATAQQLIDDGISKVGLLGTAFTMEKSFYKDRLTEKFAIEVVVPDEDQRALVHKVIYEELCLGKINEGSRTAYLEIIQQLHQRGAQAVILGCTEIALLVSQQDTNIPLYDTTAIHAAQAVRFALAQD